MKIGEQRLRFGYRTAYAGVKLRNIDSVANLVQGIIEDHCFNH